MKMSDSANKSSKGPDSKPETPGDDPMDGLNKESSQTREKERFF